MENALDTSSPHCKEDIRRAAQKLFEEKGIAKATVREIAREAGYTTGAVYFHYKNKEAIYQDIISQSLETLSLNILKASEPPKDPVSALISAYITFYRFFEDRPYELNAVLTFSRSSDPATGNSFREISSFFQTCYIRLGIPRRLAEEEATVILGDLFGLLSCTNNRQFEALGQEGEQVLTLHLQRLRSRLLELKSQN
ncbi:MAG: TetR/AcrR family transcriptional regulator [Sneathiellales bacterium]|nr:TetR/AcrR family transcriptional regulator [Sneathiellales bacterium]